MQVKKGPPKRFFATFTMRAEAPDLDRWKAAAQETPERMSMSEWARGVLNRAADKLLGRG